MLAGVGVDRRITVLNETRVISFATAGGVPLSVGTRVVEERVSENGSLVEVARNFVARCQETNDIIHFGEDVEIYENGQVVSTEGSWEAGVNGARPGIIMPGDPAPGQAHFQEIAPGVAMDFAVVLSKSEEVEVPAGEFQDVVHVLETTVLELGQLSEKWYAPEVGLIVDGALELIAPTRPRSAV